jgi:Na+/H+ antiporter NhaD/arsenite permease-like protein
VFAAASAITAVLSLDATVVLLTPVVYSTSAQLGARPKPHVYACTHLANSASLLLPESNLTNLLAFAASGLAFPRFAALMALPWLAAIATEYLVLTRFFAADLDTGAQAMPGTQPAGAPVFVLAVVAATLAGFVAAAAGADLLILARDGDRSRLGPKSLGPAGRFVVDHAPCPVLLVWPEDPPGTGTIPPPPPPPPHPPHPHR